ncbi:chlorophyllase-like protein [Yoonia maricola]|uniref:Chlorophyllase-like protein n=1 Tax=Yoonia maricola TaxID=420999 RepID=A0A2M8W556_9RHOB|nr:alpha/beta fold hydrolase [Yoonia maricola]PJI86053.1 chlorophyllase-like protein [Yoonia maricola]
MSVSVQTTPAIITFGPIALPAPDRGQDLHLRVSAPAVGDDLPVILMAHGFAKSLRDYAPLVDFWTAHGFAVIQPTFLDSATLDLAPTDPRTPDIWKHRVADMKRILDDLDQIEDVVPQLKGRLDRTRIAAVGHSYGGQTVGMLLGARVIGSDGTISEDMSDPRIKAGVLLSTTGLGGEFLTPFAAEHFSFMTPSFAELTTPALVVAGDKDDSPLSTRGPDWFTDVYKLSPGATALVTLFGGEHLLGGITGYGVTDTTDESPARVSAVQELSTAYLRTALYDDDTAWLEATKAVADSPDPQGRIEEKSAITTPEVAEAL